MHEFRTAHRCPWKVLTTPAQHQHGSQANQPPTRRPRRLRRERSPRRSPRTHTTVEAHTHTELTVHPAGDAHEPVELPDGIHEHLHRDAVHHRADDNGPIHDGDRHRHGLALAVGDSHGDDHGRGGRRVPVRVHVLELRRLPAVPDGLQLVRPQSLLSKESDLMTLSFSWQQQ